MRLAKHLAVTDVGGTALTPGSNVVGIHFRRFVYTAFVWPIGNDGTIGRKTHDPSNTFPLKPNQWNYITGLYTWKKNKE